MVLTDAQRALILDLSLKRIGEAAFMRAYPLRADERATVSGELLRRALAVQDRGGVEYGLMLGFVFEPAPDVELLCQLAVATWHARQEDVVMLLDAARDPRCIETLFAVATGRHAYSTIDDGSALARKAVWALAKLGTVDAIAKLQVLADGDDATVSAFARRRLDRTSG